MRSACVWTAAAAMLAAAAIGCGGSDEGAETSTRAESTTTQAAPSPAPTPDEPAGTGSPDRVDLYFTAGEQFEKVRRELGGAGSRLERATEALVDGPRDADAKADVALRSQIPDGVRVRRVTRDGGTVTVELSGDFDDGLGPPGSGREIRGLPQGAAVLVGAVSDLAALGLVLQPGHRLPRVPRRAPVSRLAWMRQGSGA